MVRSNVVHWLLAGALVLCVSSLQEAQAQRGGGRGGFGPQGVSPLTVVQLPGVQKELGLAQDKIDKIKDVGSDYRDEVQQELTGAGVDFRALRDASPEERAKKMAQMAEISKKVSDKYSPKLNEILDKTQQTRLHELAVQAAGPAALEDPTVAKDLGLSKDQEQKLAGISKDFQEKMRESRRGGGGGGAEKMAELREEHTAKATEVLTKDQQAKFTSMKGKLVDAKILRPQMGRRRRGNNNN